MEPMYYIGLDVHKRTISYCVKNSSGAVYSEGALSATRFDLEMERRTVGGGWIATPGGHDLSCPYAREAVRQGAARTDKGRCRTGIKG